MTADYSQPRSDCVTVCRDPVYDMFFTTLGDQVSLRSVADYSQPRSVCVTVCRAPVYDMYFTTLGEQVSLRFVATNAVAEVS